MRIQRHRLDADSIKNKITPYDFYLREQALDRFRSKSMQWAQAGLCPFHNDTTAGSFRINLQNGAYKCFSCGAKGYDILAFTKEKYNLSFAEVLEHVANEWGLS